MAAAILTQTLASQAQQCPIRAGALHGVIGQIGDAAAAEILAAAQREQQAAALSEESGSGNACGSRRRSRHS
jgi:hypothetical protein